MPNVTRTETHSYSMDCKDFCECYSVRKNGEHVPTSKGYYIGCSCVIVRALLLVQYCHLFDISWIQYRPFKNSAEFIAKIRRVFEIQGMILLWELFQAFETPYSARKTCKFNKRNRHDTKTAASWKCDWNEWSRFLVFEQYFEGAVPTIAPKASRLNWLLNMSRNSTCTTENYLNWSAGNAATIPDINTDMTIIKIKWMLFAWHRRV